MTHTTRIFRWLGLLCALATLLALAPALPTWAADPADQQISTRYFTIIYPPGEDETATWYAGFVDDVDTAVSELLGAEPVSGLTLHIYATEDEYQAANPLAEVHPDILAHAIPDRKEVGVAVERLREQAPELARVSFRHEMTHVVAGALSNQNLPVDFQEGLAQYNELSRDRAEGVARIIEQAQTNGLPLLSWNDLSNSGIFRRRLDLAYPQSYTVMAFLAERYGMGAFARFLAALRDTSDYRAALHTAYDKAPETLEEEWRAYLPDFLKDGWERNVLTDYDMQPGLALYQAGRFAEAQDYLARSQRLYEDLGRTGRAQQAATALHQAKQAEQADGLLTQARQALETHDYAGAQQSAAVAGQTFAALDLPSYRDQADSLSGQSRQGLEAQTQLAEARAALARFDWRGAEQDARAAGEAFATLGDAARVAEVNTLLGDLWQWERAAGLGAAGAGSVVLVFGLLVALRTRRHAPLARAAVSLAEEEKSWL